MTRGRPASVRRSSALEVSLDEELRTRLDIKLWSTAENRVPKGAYKAYFDRLVARDLTITSLDLAAFAGSAPGQLLIFGPPESVAAVEQLLKASQS